MKLNTIKLIIGIILLLVITFITLIPKHLFLKEENGMEEFRNMVSIINNKSSFDYYQDGTNPNDIDRSIIVAYNSLLLPDSSVISNGGMLSDRNTSLMFYRRCLLLKNNNLDDFISSVPTTFRNMGYIDQFGIYTNNMADVEFTIINKMTTFSQRHGNIEGDIHLIILQSPYYRTNNQNIAIRSATFGEINDGYTPKYIYKKSGDNSTLLDAQPIYYYVLMIYSSYNNNDISLKQCNTSNNDIDSYLNLYFSKDEQCYMKCMNDSKACGCATQVASKATTITRNAASEAGTIPYDSTCIGPSATQDPKKPLMTPAIYASAYIINQSDQRINRLFKINNNCTFMNKI
jgi:hypothetical protein